MDQTLTSHDALEKKVDEHSLQIQELKDEVDFKRWKIDSLIEKIDNLTKVVQEIQLNQLKDDNDLMNRVTAIESSLTTIKWGFCAVLTIVGLVIAYLSMRGGAL